MPQRQWDDSSRDSSSSSSYRSTQSSSSSRSSHSRRDDNDDNGSQTPATPEQIFWSIVILLAVGLLALILPAIAEANDRAQAQREREAATATTRAITLADIDQMWAAIEPRLANWKRTVKLGQWRSLTAREAGMSPVSNTQAVVYGYCESEHFYVFVLNELRPVSWRGDTDGYVYVPGTHPMACHPAGWEVVDSVSAEVTGWHFVLLNMRAATQAAVPTRTPVLTFLPATPTSRP